MRLGHLGDLFRSSFGDNLASGLAAFRTEIDNPVGRFDDIEIVLNDDERIAGIHKFVEDRQQLLDVVEVQACRRFIQNIELVVCRRIFEFRGDL